ncbi:hypothetical protein OSB04_026890 [Centaurea solstitialis]|uniref:Spt5 KOW domain-containing protein n=1 Tax=Centaurea solstitialis TaxID=347529 RepID=A0AA38SE54_9ASTR|nr:hypothetical protein OSB04_026890 [Centaurea solstitialis]
MFVFTGKSAEVCGKTSGVSMGDEQDSTKAFELLGGHGSSQDSNCCKCDTRKATVSLAFAGCVLWSFWEHIGQMLPTAVLWSSLAHFPAIGSSVCSDLHLVDVGGSAWKTKTTQDQSSEWGAAASEKKGSGSGAVKSEHLAAVCGKTSGASMGWMDGGVASETGGWNTGRPSTESRTAFGIVIGCEKDALSLFAKKARFDKKFNGLDQHKKIISMNDNVRVLEGPLEDKMGIVEQIYKGVVFLLDENETENCGYFVPKQKYAKRLNFLQMNSKELKGKGGKSHASSVGIHIRNTFVVHTVHREEKDGFSVGQSLRICLVPLKGYMCRVLTIR